MAFTDQVEDQNKPKEVEQQQQPQKTELLFTVGDRTYNSTEEVVNKIQHQDSHIKTIEQENAELKAKLQEAQEQNNNNNKVDELLNKLDSNEKADQTSQVSTEELANQAAQAAVNLIAQQNQQATRAQNAEAAEQAARKAYGDKYNEVIMSKGKELGMSVAQVNQLAETSPAAFANLFLNVEDNAGPGPSRGDHVQDPNPAQQKQSINWNKLSHKERMAYTTEYMRQHSN